MTLTSPVAFERRTKETEVQVRLWRRSVRGGALDSDSPDFIRTGIGMLDHLIGALAFHARLGIELRVIGDTVIDDHHTTEDAALGLGEALRKLIDAEPCPRRYGSILLPMDEVLIEAACDVIGRPWAAIDLRFTREFIGELATENVEHFFRSLAFSARICLHLAQRAPTSGVANAHHLAEAAFKAVGRSLEIALSADTSEPPPGSVSSESRGFISTKGVVS